MLVICAEMTLVNIVTILVVLVTGGVLVVHAHTMIVWSRFMTEGASLSPTGANIVDTLHVGTTLVGAIRTFVNVLLLRLKPIL